MQAKFIRYGLLFISLQSTVTFSSQKHVDPSSSTKLPAQQPVNNRSRTALTSRRPTAEQLAEVSILDPSIKQVEVDGVTYIKLVDQEQEKWVVLVLPKLLKLNPEQLETVPVRRTNPLNDIAYQQTSRRTNEALPAGFRSATSQIDQMIEKARARQLANIEEL
ncbi:MAG: hypothetical protein NTZ68_01820 [Candidatus Dependentiae bacterium]|nr:hypothetical protein [Candidatus Dependentiae bacterium]